MKISQFAYTALAVASLGSTLVAQQSTQQQPIQTPNRQIVPGQSQVPGQPNQGQVNQNQVNPGQVGRTANQTGQMQHGNHQNLDQTLATCLAIENQEEIKLAKFAKEKAKSDEVKEFASMLAEDHQTCLEKLNAVAGNSGHSSSNGSTGSNSNGQSSTSGSSNQNNGQGGTRNSPTQNQSSNQSSSGTTATTASHSSNNTSGNSNSGSSLDMVQLHREMAEQCLTDSKKMLNEKDGSEFDKCFIGMQIAKHAGMQTKLTVLQRHATGELKNVIAEGLETTKKHLKKAENLMDRLDEDGSSKKSRKSES